MLLTLVEAPGIVVGIHLEKPAGAHPGTYRAPFQRAPCAFDSLQPRRPNGADRFTYPNRSRKLRKIEVQTLDRAGGSGGDVW
jgi:hypothetical protein